jgi:hypothetical protein
MAPRHFKWNGFETPHDRKAIDAPAPRFAWHILAVVKENRSVLHPLEKT